MTNEEEAELKRVYEVYIDGKWHTIFLTDRELFNASRHPSQSEKPEAVPCEDEVEGMAKVIQKHFGIIEVTPEQIYEGPEAKIMTEVLNYSMTTGLAHALIKAGFGSKPEAGKPVLAIIWPEKRDIYNYENRDWNEAIDACRQTVKEAETGKG